MSRDWNLVSVDGYDVEPEPNGRAANLECPNCERTTRFETRLLVKNLRVLGVPVLASGKPRKVMQCSSCGVCVDPPQGVAPEEGEENELRKKLRRAEEDLTRWTHRAELAAQQGDEQLARDALVMVRKLKKDAAELRGRLEVKPAGKPKVVQLPKEPKPEEKDDDAAFRALKRKLAARPPEPEESKDAPKPEEPKPEEPKAEPKPEAPAKPEEPPPPPGPTQAEQLENELAALKARFSSGNKGATASPAPTTAANTEADALAALKRRLASKNQPQEAAPPPAPERKVEEPLFDAPAPEPTGEPGGEDDPLAKLKNKLKKK